ncbi:MAG: branched-chain amino acid ABC transporter permease [Thaumarchaeota archaeon]|nr:branched-chain amino acid ABC transporter permease [Nitrososphaerota archaeon]
MRYGFVLIIIMFCALLVAPFFLPSYLIRLLILTLFFATIAEAWNLIGGYGNLLSLGNAAFIGIGAYTSTLLYLNNHVSPFLGMFVGAALSALTAIGFGLVTIRLKGIYFAMGTLGFTEVLLLIFLNLGTVTGGAVGLPISPNGESLFYEFNSNIPYYFIILALCSVTVLVTYRMLHTTWGYYVRAIGNDEILAQSIGINPTREKIMAFVVSAILTSFAGTFYAQYITFIDPNSVFSVNLSIQLVLIAVIGGISTIFGPIIGAFVFVPVEQYTISYIGQTAGSLDLVVYGAILIVVVLFAPRGLISGFAKTWNAMLRKVSVQAK